MARRETVRLRSRSLLAELLAAHQLSYRDAADRLNGRCGKTMIGKLVTGEKLTCSAEVGAAIEEMLGQLPGILFVPVASTQTHELSQPVNSATQRIPA